MNNGDPIRKSDANFYTIVAVTLFIGVGLFAGLIYCNLTLSSFQDDAYWLLPSLAHDLDSGITWQEQLARDSGERGAFSLNLWLRILYAVWGSQYSVYLIVGLCLHALCTFLLVFALRECRLRKDIAYFVGLLFFFCSEHYHAYFWVIGHQHILSLISILLAFVVTNRLMRISARGFFQFKFRNYVFMIILFFSLSVNRVSAFFIIAIQSILFFYHKLKFPLKPAGKRIGLYDPRILIFCVTAVSTSIFPIFQTFSGHEGWQISSFINPLLPSFLTGEDDFYFALAMCSVVLFIAVVILFAEACVRLKESFSIKNKNFFPIVVYFMSVIAIPSVILLNQKTTSVIPALIENLFYKVQGPSILSQRWSPIFQIEFADLWQTEFANLLISGLLFALVVLIRPRNSRQYVLSSLFFMLVAAGLTYFNSLAKHLELTSIPSRYVYYFTPALCMSLGLMADFCLRFARPILRIFWLAVVGLIFAFINFKAINTRFNESNKANLFLPFQSLPPLMLAETLSEWVKKNNFSEKSLRLNVPVLEKYRWQALLSAYVPQSNSNFSPVYFQTQSFLNNLIPEFHVRLNNASSDPEIGFCDTWLCDRNRRPIPFPVQNCVDHKISFKSAARSDFFSYIVRENDTFDTATLKPVLLWWSLFDHPDFLFKMSASLLLKAVDVCDLHSSERASDFEKSLLGLWQSGQKTAVVFWSEGNLVASDSEGKNWILKRPETAKFNLKNGTLDWPNGETWVRPDYTLSAGVTSFVVDQTPVVQNISKILLASVGVWYSGRYDRSLIMLNTNGTGVLVFFPGHAYKIVMSGNRLRVPDLRIEGELSADQKQIVWSDGSIFERSMNLHSPIDGSWKVGGKYAFVQRITRTWFRFQNERGEHALGRAENNRISVERWNLNGLLSSDLMRLTWDNGSYWEKDEK